MRYTQTTGTIAMIIMVFGVMYACADAGINAAKAQADKNEHDAQQRALLRLSQPIKFSLPEHYLEMVGEQERVERSSK